MEFPERWSKVLVLKNRWVKTAVKSYDTVESVEKELNKWPDPFLSPTESRKVN